MIRLETWNLEPSPPTITLTLASRPRATPCPLCARQAKRTHSRYERRLADLPWGEYRAAIRLKVRRLFCDNAQCARRVFTERLPGVVAPWARRTARLADRLTAVGRALGGAAGARLVRRSRLDREPQHAAGSGPAGARAACRDTVRSRRGRLGDAPAVHLRHGAGGLGTSPPGGAAARPRGGHARGLAARAPRRRGDRA